MQMKNEINRKCYFTNQTGFGFRRYFMKLFTCKLLYVFTFSVFSKLCKNYLKNNFWLYLLLPIHSFENRK